MTVQTTLKDSIHFTGIGLHSGAKVRAVLRPAPANSGITFIRTDVAHGHVAARWDSVVDTRLCTVIGNAEGVRVGTIEHLMAAFAGNGIDNAQVELDGPEVPIMDGSSAEFMFLLDCAGRTELGARRRVLRVLRPVALTDGDRSVSLAPASSTSFGFEIAFDSAAIARQARVHHLSSAAFKADIARARTFGFLHEVDALRKAGLAQGGSLANAVVIDGDRVVNPEGLRFPDEFVRHKILDAVGDLYLAGAPILGRFHGVRSGHALNNRLLHALYADRTAWALEDESTADLGMVIERGRGERIRAETPELAVA